MGRRTNRAASMTYAPTSKPGKAPLDATSTVKKAKIAKQKRGAKAKATSGDFPLAADPRVAEIEVDLTPPPPADPPRKGGRRPPCPVTALGTYDGVYFFLSRRGEYRVLGYNQLRQQGIVSLFDGDTRWLRSECAVYDKDGKPTGGWSE